MSPSDQVTGRDDAIARGAGHEGGPHLGGVVSAGHPSRAEPEDCFVADITERLMTEFDERASVSIIGRIVLECRHDLQGSPVLALPELVERLARQRLLQIRTGR